MSREQQVDQNCKCLQHVFQMEIENDHHEESMLMITMTGR